MKFAKVRFETDEACAKALKGLATRMRVTVLRDESFVLPEAGLEWLRSEGLSYQLLEWLNQDGLVQALRDNLPTRYNDGQRIEPSASSPRRLRIKPVQ